MLIQSMENKAIPSVFFPSIIAIRKQREADVSSKPANNLITTPSQNKALAQYPQQIKQPNIFVAYNCHPITNKYFNTTCSVNMTD